jgi:hypothetical protein
VEGMENEEIVSSGIYYYDDENVEESKFQFRRRIHEPYYAQYDENGLAYVYDLGESSSLVQEIGFISSTEGRCIVFPNVYQHIDLSFSLKDKQKSGHRKMLSFFLVGKKILSTSDVPPQQKEWIKKEMIKFNVFGLPNEIISLICDFMDYPIEFQETLKDKTELMEEISSIHSKVNDSFLFNNVGEFMTVIKY